MSCQGSSLFTAQRQKGKELTYIYFSPFEKRVTLQSAALAILLEIFSLFFFNFKCSSLDSLMKNREKECHCQGEWGPRYRPCSILCSFLFPLFSLWACLRLRAGQTISLKPREFYPRRLLGMLQDFWSSEPRPSRPPT